MPSFIDPEQIFPKRLGIINANTLVLEYYNAAKDKFKKHLMPFEPTADPKSIVQQIFKNSKHVPYLKKVNPKHLRAVVDGDNLGFKKDNQQNNYPQFLQAKVQKQNKENGIFYAKDNINVAHKEKQWAPQTNTFTIPPKKQAEIMKQVVKKAEQPQQYYNEQFEQFQISVSIDKGKSNISSNFSKLESSLQQKSNSSKISQISKIQPVIPKKPGKAALVQEVVEQYEDDFQFIDEKAKQKKGKKDKKQKSKSKSKQKKQKKPKEDKKQSKKGSRITQSENKTVQQQFDFL